MPITKDQALVPLTCGSCEGKGGEEYDYCPVNGCPGPQSPEGCFHAQRGWNPCEECAGEGIQRCAACGAPAVMISVDDEATCETCGREAEGQIPMFGAA